MSIQSPAGAAAGSTRVRIWDLPTRLFHWTLAVLVVVLVVTAQIGGNAMAWHMRCGLAVGALLGFRLVWGLAGGRWSRFASFLHSPAALRRYLRGTPLPGERLDVGHSPTGALSVFALLGLLAAQVATGLVADDEIATTGPLNRFVDTDTGLAATAWHTGLGKALIIALVLLHVVAIVWYRVRRRQDLVGPMLHGDKTLPPSVPASADSIRTRLLALVILAGWIAVAVSIASLG